VNMARGFMGQSWDGTGIAFDPATWAEVLRVMRPGAYLLAFGGTRTYHRMTCAIEDAGFIVRDCIMWLHGQGFPKSHNIGDGIGTALKPAVEPIVLAQKPLDGTYKNNYARWGCGALNIDAARIGTGDDRASGGGLGLPIRGYHGWDARTDRPTGGRWPANAVFSHADGCEEVGARKVKAGGGPAAVIRTSAGYEGASLGKDSRAEGTLCTSHRDADGMETVSAWRCVEGGTVTTYAYEYKLDALTPLSEPAHLLDRLQSLLQDLREHSTNGNSLLQNASAFYRSEHRQSAAGPDGLSDAVAYALRLTELPGFQSGYQSCPRFCDAHGCPVAELDRQSGVSTSGEPVGNAQRCWRLSERHARYAATPAPPAASFSWRSHRGPSGSVVLLRWRGSGSTMAATRRLTTPTSVARQRA
jgi:hypothetical protein